MRSRLTQLLFLLIVVKACSPSSPRPQSPPLSPQPRRSRSRRRRRFSDRFSRCHGHDSHTDDDYSYPLEHTQSHGQRHNNHDQNREYDAPPARPTRKTVRWGPVTAIPSPDYRSRSRSRSPDYEHSPGGYSSSCILAARPCLKPPTPLDQEMVLRNLRAMVDETTNRLDLYYNAVEYFSGDVVLDEVMCHDERYLFQRARRQSRSLEDTFGFVGSPSRSSSRSSSRNSV